MLIVLPFVLIDTRPVALNELVAGAEIFTTLLLVPDNVRLIPEYPMVEPVAVVFPAVFAPSRLIALFSAAAPGAATEAVIIDPAEVPKVTLLALLKARVVNEKDPLEADATGVTPPPAAALKLNVNPALLLAVVPLRFVRFSCGFP